MGFYEVTGGVALKRPAREPWNLKKAHTHYKNMVYVKVLLIFYAKIVYTLR